MEVSTSVDFGFYKNQSSQYMCKCSEGRLNATTDLLTSINVVLPLQNPKNSLKIGLGYATQNYSFGNNPFNPVFFLTPIDTEDEIDRVNIRSKFISIPFAFQRQVKANNRVEVEVFSFGLITNILLDKHSFLDFNFEGMPPNFFNNYDFEKNEKEVGTHYLATVPNITLKVYAAYGVDWRVFHNFHLFLNTRLGAYLNSPNKQMMNHPISLGLNLGLRINL